VFDDIGDIGLLAVDPRLHETAVQKPSRWSYEGVSGKIFGVARLLADQHDPGSLRSFAEHGLCGVLVQIAAGASSGGVAQCADCRLDRDQVPGIFGWLRHRHASGRGVHRVNAAQQGCVRTELPFFSTAKAAYPQSCPHGKVPNRRPSTEI